MPYRSQENVTGISSVIVLTYFYLSTGILLRIKARKELKCGGGRVMHDKL
jgi:hypothetical protein